MIDILVDFGLSDPLIQQVVIGVFSLVIGFWILSMFKTLFLGLFDKL